MKILDEMILLLGYLATPSGSGASSVFAGWRNGVMIVQALCDLDISYFISPARREVLLPSLVISTYYNPELLQVMEESVSRSLLQQYLGGYVTAAANGGVVSSIAGAGSTGSAGGGAGASAGGGGGGAGSGGGGGGAGGGGVRRFLWMDCLVTGIRCRPQACLGDSIWPLDWQHRSGRRRLDGFSQGPPCRVLIRGICQWKQEGIGTTRMRTRRRREGWERRSLCPQYVSQKPRS